MKKYGIALTAALIVWSTGVLWVQAVTADSEANISFTASTGPTRPVDPENPGTDDTDKPTVEGSLAILTVTPFTFKSGTVSTATQFYEITTQQPNIQVVDLRGSSSGWTVTAKITAFKNTTTQAESLRGAAVHIYDGRPNSITSFLYAPEVPDGGATLTADSEAALVFEADNGKGAGLWVMRFYPEDDSADAFVKLEVPAGSATTGSHQATITWELSDAV